MTDTTSEQAVAEADIRATFERVTESYYEGDFAKYEPNGDYVSAQQQDDFVMFTSGFAQGMNHIVEKACAVIAAMQVREMTVEEAGKLIVEDINKGEAANDHVGERYDYKSAKSLAKLGTIRIKEGSHNE